jgi:hypothetical protein
MDMGKGEHQGTKIHLRERQESSSEAGEVGNLIIGVVIGRKKKGKWI